MQVLTQGFAKATHVTRAWVISGGVDAGVMSMIGTGIRKVRIMLSLGLVRPGPDPGPRPAPPTLPTPTLSPRAHPKYPSHHYRYPGPSPQPRPRRAQAGIWAPVIGVSPWGVLDEELQNGMQSAHDTGAAYEVPRRRGIDVELGEDSMRDSFSGRRGRATT